jgi:hypothetical protein
VRDFVECSEIAALIVTYRRYSSIEELVGLCVNAGISRIYISSDGSKGSLDNNDVVRVRGKIDIVKHKYPDQIFVHLHSENLGAAVNVLRSCDWVFSQETFAIVLEDDCIPTSDFFSFVAEFKETLITRPEVYMICGSQFAPVSVTSNQACISIYPMVWGWASSKEKWRLLSSKLSSQSNSHFKFLKSGSNDQVFWRAGARRALEGFVDAWDIPIVNVLREIGGKVIVPGVNLITNIGGDDKATHTVMGSIGLNTPTGIYQSSSTKIESNSDLDKWTKKNVFSISYRHQYSTRLTFILDKIKFHKPIKEPLLKRW